MSSSGPRRTGKDEKPEAEAYVALMKVVKGYDDPLRYETFGAGDAGALCTGVTSLAIANACSLHLEPGASPVIFAQPNCVSELTFDSAEYDGPPLFKLASGDQAFDPPYADHRRAIAALASKDLTLEGSVLAIGSWDFRGGTTPNDNARFLQNVWQWLKG